jgi:hypothetical protein
MRSQECQLAAIEHCPPGTSRDNGAPTLQGVDLALHAAQHGGVFVHKVVEAAQGNLEELGKAFDASAGAFTTAWNQGLDETVTTIAPPAAPAPAPAPASSGGHSAYGEHVHTTAKAQLTKGSLTDGWHALPATSRGAFKAWPSSHCKGFIWPGWRTLLVAGRMFLSAGEKQPAAIAHIPKQLAAEKGVDVKDWMHAALEHIKGAKVPEKTHHLQPQTICKL